MQDVIIKEEKFKHPIDKVWNAITQAEEISKWFIDADFKPEPGSAYVFTAPPEQNCTQITGVVKVATPYTLIYTWVMQNTDVETTVKWTLEEEGDYTVLHLEHSGISNYEGETAVKMFESYSGGWLNCVTELSAYLNKLEHAGAN